MKENKEKGYISIFRSIMDHYLYPNKRVFTTFEAFMDLLLCANYKDNNILIGMTKTTIKRGQLLTSEFKLGNRWMWNRDKVRNFLKMLAKDTTIIKESYTKYTIITICNFDSYQDIYPTKQQQSDIKPTTKQQQSDTNNKENKVNKENKEIIKEETEPVSTDIKFEKPLWAFEFKNYNPEIKYPFEFPEFCSIWDLWIEYRKEKKLSKYKKIGEQAALKSLSELSNNSIETAKKIIEQSISNNWQGLFEIKNNGRNSNNQQTSKYRTII